jgi:UDP-4-amino-4,6-dideoxy-N-acetyl-beta-L-altrosamine transaminase
MSVPYSRQSIDLKDISSVSKVLKSDFLTTGPKIKEFEEKLRLKFNSKFAVVVNSATSALHLTCMAFDLSNKDTVWTTAISFVASANCAVYCGARVDFVDIDNDTFNICEKKLEEKLIRTPKKKRPKVVIVVHLSGHPANLKRIKYLSNKFRFKIIEDASHAAGSKYHNHLIGNCKFSDACIFSFYPTKIITTGEGGCILTNSKKIFSKTNILRSHGINKNIKLKNNPWHYDQTSLGYNYRMNDIEASLGISQLSKLNKFVRERNKIAIIYKKKLNLRKIKVQSLLPSTKSSMHLFIIRINRNLRKKIYFDLKKNGFNSNLHYMPIYRHSFYQKYKFNKKNFINAEQYYKEAISLPLYYGLKEKKLKKIIKIINNVLSK